jgi:hypothetical protein
VTGGPPLRGGGGMPQRIITNSRSSPALRTTGAVIWKHAGHRRQVADVPVDHAEERADGFLVRGDAVEVAHYGR